MLEIIIIMKIIFFIIIMKFINRKRELQRLDQVVESKKGGLIVIWGRRRLGKTRLLLEWSQRHKGIYSVADASAPPVQRRYLAEAMEARFPHFSQVEYPDWAALLNRLAEEAQRSNWHGPLILDEIPYLASVSPELPSVLQRWIDHEAKAAKLVVVLAGSSQRMMQGMVLEAEAPLYGRACQLLKLSPLPAGHIGDALSIKEPKRMVEAYTLWGGVPRYWELAKPFEEASAAADRLVLDPMGPLHEEPQRLLLEETPPALRLRPILDAIGMGDRRLSGIASRLQQKATSLTRPLVNLQELDLVMREVPFGESEKSSKRALYRIADPFLRLWFTVVAPRRALMAAAPSSVRQRCFSKAFSALIAETWEELCRKAVPLFEEGIDLGIAGPWGPARRFWHGKDSEWDVVSASLDGTRLLLGEAKWPAQDVTADFVYKSTQELIAKGIPSTCRAAQRVEYALFVPRLPQRSQWPFGDNVHLVDARCIMEVLRDEAA